MEREPLKTQKGQLVEIFHIPSRTYNHMAEPDCGVNEFTIFSTVGNHSRHLQMPEDETVSSHVELGCMVWDSICLSSRFEWVYRGRS